MGFKVDIAYTQLTLGEDIITGVATSIGDPGVDTNVASEKAVRDSLNALPSRWSAVAAFTRVSNSTFTVTDNAENQTIFIKGRWLKYRETGGTWRYGMVILYAAGTVTLDGHPLTTLDDDEMEYGDLGVGGTITFVIPGNAVVADPASFVYYWQKAGAFIIRSTWKVDAAPTGSTILGNVEVNGADIHASEIIISSTTEVSSGVDIQVGNYDIQFGETLAVTFSQVGSTVPGGNATTVTVSYVIP